MTPSPIDEDDLGTSWGILLTYNTPDGREQALDDLKKNSKLSVGTLSKGISVISVPGRERSTVSTYRAVLLSFQVTPVPAKN
jgi:hypothetical protein